MTATMGQGADRTPLREAGPVFGMLGGPIAWFAHLMVSYPLVEPICATGWTLLFHLVTAGTMLVAAAAGGIAWRNWRRVGRGVADESPPPRGRDRFMAFYGMLSSGFFLFVILVEGLPAIVVDPCTS